LIARRNIGENKIPRSACDCDDRGDGRRQPGTGHPRSPGFVRSEDQKTFHRTFADPASAAEKIDGEKEGTANAFSFAHRTGIAIPERAADANAFSFAECDGFSNTERNGNPASDRRDISARTRDSNTAVNA